MQMVGSYPRLTEKAPLGNLRKTKASSPNNGNTSVTYALGQ